MSCFDRTSLFKRQKLRSSIGMCSQRTQQGTAPVIPAISAKKRSILFPRRVHLSRFYQTSTSFLRNIFHYFTLVQRSWISSHCTHFFFFFALLLHMLIVALFFSFWIICVCNNDFGLHLGPDNCTSNELYPKVSHDWKKKTQGMNKTTDIEIILF